MTGRGLIIAAPASGSGKTLVALGLLRHLRRRGIAVAAAKAGPDYVDPTFLAAASGRPCVNLDPWAMRPATLAGMVGDLEASAELVLCEGVMGLFDGAGASGEDGSTAELARITGWPVILVVDARGQGASAAALLRGFREHDRDVAIAGVVFNRVAGPRHRALLEEAVARHLPQVACLGALPRAEALDLAERHLGLVPAGETCSLEPRIERASALVAAAVDTESLIATAQASIVARTASGRGLPPLGQRIAVARDDAFLFLYEATVAGWRECGCETSFFSPLADEPPDADADAVYLPGGYPELHAGRLSQTRRFIDGLRQAAARGKTIYGECGGFMVLGDLLIAADGRAYPMAGLLGLRTSFADRRRHLGYREAMLLAATPLGAAGVRFRGHEFHYATTVSEAGSALFSVADSRGRNLGRTGLRRGRVAGSFIHLIDTRA
ncbi:MAG: cobyrinate a,c-diamide synthase [Alphaproteobacteria bacterium]|nr:cobyrinate a,c-diamide synthase [Alphaproteobacteria bacterium]